GEASLREGRPGAIPGHRAAGPGAGACGARAFAGGSTGGGNFLTIPSPVPLPPGRPCPLRESDRRRSGPPSIGVRPGTCLVPVRAPEPSPISRRRPHLGGDTGRSGSLEAPSALAVRPGLDVPAGEVMPGRSYPPTWIPTRGETRLSLRRSRWDDLDRPVKLLQPRGRLRRIAMRGVIAVAVP